MPSSTKPAIKETAAKPLKITTEVLDDGVERLGCFGDQDWGDKPELARNCEEAYPYESDQETHARRSTKSHQHVVSQPWEAQQHHKVATTNNTPLTTRVIAGS